MSNLSAGGHEKTQTIKTYYASFDLIKYPELVKMKLYYKIGLIWGHTYLMCHQLIVSEDLMNSKLFHNSQPKHHENMYLHFVWQSCL